MASSSDRKGSIPPGYQDISQFSAYLDQCSKEVLNFIKVETESGLITYQGDQVLEENDIGEPLFEIKFIKQLYIAALYRKMIMLDPQIQKSK